VDIREGVEPAGVREGVEPAGGKEEVEPAGVIEGVFTECGTSVFMLKQFFTIRNPLTQ